MKILKKIDWSLKSIAKAIGALFVGIIALTIAISLISFALKTIFSSNNNNLARYGGMAFSEEAADYGVDEGGSFFSKSMSPPRIAPQGGGGFSAGLDAENFEIKSYNASISTKNLDRDCQSIANLKDKDYIIFENSNKNEENCYYSFKVKKENEQEIISTIEALNPESFNANIYTIKRNLENIDSELNILKKKLTSIEETLESAQESYDSISVIATKNQDAETLAKIITSKLKLIDKLSNERLNTKAQIDRYTKNKSEQLDRLDFTFFTVNVYKDVIIDWKNVKDSWKWEAKQLVNNLNEVAQDVTLGLVTHLAKLAQVVIYLFLSLFLLRFIWTGIKRVWKHGKKSFKK